MILDQIQKEVHQRLLNIRRIERLVLSKEFEIAYVRANEKAKQKVIEIIKQGSNEQLTKWIKFELEEGIGDYTIRQLRLIASQYGIPNYGVMLKSQLLSSILGALDEKGKNYHGIGTTIYSDAISDDNQIEQIHNQINQ